jgi:uncharacterized protein
MKKNYKERLREYLYKILSTKGSEHSIALGFAVGTFFCILPTFGFTIWLLIILSLIFKRINKLALFGSLIVWNPFLLFPTYYLAYRLGNWIYRNSPVVDFKFTLSYQIYNLSRRFLIGDLILAVSISILSYFIIKIIMKKYKAKILKKLKKKK